MKKNQNGITLIALIITIIVLLILAGVSIALVLGNNGVLTKAKESAVKNTHAQIYDAFQIAIADYLIEKEGYEKEISCAEYLLEKEIISEIDDEDNKFILNVDKLLPDNNSEEEFMIEYNDEKEEVIITSNGDNDDLRLLPIKISNFYSF